MGKGKKKGGKTKAGDSRGAGDAPTDQTQPGNQPSTSQDGSGDATNQGAVKTSQPKPETTGDQKRARPEKLKTRDPAGISVVETSRSPASATSSQKSGHQQELSKQTGPQQHFAQQGGYQQQLAQQPGYQQQLTQKPGHQQQLAKQAGPQQHLVQQGGYQQQLAQQPGYQQQLTQKPGHQQQSAKQAGPQQYLSQKGGYQQQLAQQPGYQQQLARQPGYQQQLSQQPGYQQQLPQQPGYQQQLPQQPGYQQQLPQQPGYQQQLPQQPGYRQQLTQEPGHQQQFARHAGPQQHLAQQGGHQQQLAQQPGFQQQLAKQSGHQQLAKQSGHQQLAKQSGHQQQLTQQQQVSQEQQISTLPDKMIQMSITGKRQTPGTKGRKIPIETNYLRLDLGKLTVAYHYDVEIIPDTPKKYLRKVVEEFRKKYFSRYHPAFDGRKNIFSPFVLVEQGQPLSGEIKILDELNGKEKIFKVKVQYANTVDLTPLHNVQKTQYSPQEALQCVEIVLRSAPSSRCISVGRSFFTRPPGIIDLGEGMEMYQGFYQSVVRGWKTLLNVDVAHKAFPKEIGLVALIIELLSDFRYQLREDDLRARELDMTQKKTVEKFLRTLRVVYEIKGQPGSKREYRVNGIKECPKRKTFRPDNGPEMTIEEYFARKKNYRLQYPLLPSIWVGNVQRSDPILLPAELCTLLPGQAVNRKMTEGQTSAMIRRAATSTTVRKEKILNSLQQTNHNSDLCIKEFGFTIGSAFEKIQARVLDPPSLAYFNGTSVRPSKGVWRADNVRFLKGAEIQKWTIISTCGPMDMGRLAEMIFNIGPKCGMMLLSKAETPFEVVRKPPNFGNILNSLQKCSDKKYDLVFVIIPDSGPIYSDVKRAAELNIGCLTQCIKRSTLFKKLNPATVNNILLKVNSKLNGLNHSLLDRPNILSQPCMIMGADVTHPSPDSQNIPSVAAVTASHDPKAFCYNICCRLQSPKMEIISDLQDITREQLIYFYQKNNGQKPRRIVFFRDGVSEGQFNEVLSKELSAIRRACTSLENDYKPSITFLVVQKRHHTRFFPMDKRDSDDKNFNVPAGTCVDTDITNPNLQDFYLVSHASIQGVAKPTKYCTLWDDNNMNNDEIEALTYHLCHLFSRCNRSVSYPAPTYYAHLAAARAKVYIEQINLDLTRLDYEQKNIKILDSIRKQKPMFFV
ncbi:hypothetical protein WA026_008044 [Henosepilachna vigintioctopunctata]|uniref:Argonaute 2 n=1 Tax=Henosepilachna vigintioctopunctata TaxID=420089 RepID=A0AAW1TRR8_9CUCU